MNARSHTLDLVVERGQVYEAVACVFHTILFHRSLGKFTYKQEGQYSLGTVGFKDVDCEFIDLTYVCSSSKLLDQKVNKEVAAFINELQIGTERKTGEISLEFYQKKKNIFWPTEWVPWEIWHLRVEIITIRNEYDRLEYREKLGEILAEKTMYISETMSKFPYVPKMPSQSEVDMIFDTSYPDVQPYLFKFSYPTEPSVGWTMRQLVRGALNL